MSLYAWRAQMRNVQVTTFSWKIYVRILKLSTCEGRIKLISSEMYNVEYILFRRESKSVEVYTGVWIAYLILHKAFSEEPSLLASVSKFLLNINKMCSKDLIRTSKHIVNTSKVVKSSRLGNIVLQNSKPLFVSVLGRLPKSHI